MSSVEMIEDLDRVKNWICACMQCGTCTASCPNAFAMDRTPREIWRLALLGRTEDIFQSRSFTLCSACYFCTLRCPRGLPLTDAMAALKQIAAREKISRYKETIEFSRCFMESVRRHGRVREIGFISAYFLSLGFRKPMLPLSYAGVGIRLMARGKLGMPRVGLRRPRRPLAPLFRKAAELEARP